MHIAKSPNEVQLWSVIPYAIATPITVVVAFVSDRTKLRGTIMLITLPVAIVGYAVIANINSPKAKLAMTCFMATGLHASVPCILTWNTNNSAGHYKRATSSGLQIAIANCGGFVASKWSYLFQPQDVHDRAPCNFSGSTAQDCNLEAAFDLMLSLHFSLYISEVSGAKVPPRAHRGTRSLSGRLVSVSLIAWLVWQPFLMRTDYSLMCCIAKRSIGTKQEANMISS
jgi:hypothetical protein